MPNESIRTVWHAIKNPSDLAIAGVFLWAEDRPALPGTGANVSQPGCRVAWRLLPFGQVEVNQLFPDKVTEGRVVPILYEYDLLEVFKVFLYPSGQLTFRTPALRTMVSAYF